MKTVAELRRWLNDAPPELTVSCSAIAALLERLTEPAALSIEPTEQARSVTLTWRERLWEVPSETRLGVLEVAQALGRPKSWVYRHTSEASGLVRLPHRKLDGELLFSAGELRAWIREHEEVICAGPSAAPVKSHLKVG